MVETESADMAGHHLLSWVSHHHRRHRRRGHFISLLHSRSNTILQPLPPNTPSTLTRTALKYLTRVDAGFARPLRSLIGSFPSVKKPGRIRCCDATNPGLRWGAEPCILVRWKFSGNPRRISVSVNESHAPSYSAQP